MNVYGYIYKITNTVNGKVYIGQTKQSFNERYSASGNGIERVYKYHKRKKERGYNYNIHLLRAIRTKMDDRYHGNSQRELNSSLFYYIFYKVIPNQDTESIISKYKV